MFSKLVVLLSVAMKTTCKHVPFASVDSFVIVILQSSCHIVKESLLRILKGGLHRLASLDMEAVGWLNNLTVDI